MPLVPSQVCFYSYGLLSSRVLFRGGCKQSPHGCSGHLHRSIAPTTTSFEAIKHYTTVACPSRHADQATSAILSARAGKLSNLVIRSNTTMIDVRLMSTYGNSGAGPPNSSPFYTSSRSYEKVRHQDKSLDSGKVDTFEVDRQKMDNIARTRLIPSFEIVDRQQRLMQLILESMEKMNLSGTPVILIPNTNPLFHPNTKIPVSDCKQNTDFTYLTGLHAGWADQSTADCVLALYLNGDHQSKHLRSIMFAPMKTKSEQVWFGENFHQLHSEELAEVANEVRPLEELVDFVNDIVRDDRQNVFVSRNGLQLRPELLLRLKYFVRYSSDPMPTMKVGGGGGGDNDHLTIVVRDASRFIDQLRSIKSTNELAALKRVGEIGAMALGATMAWTRQMLQTTATGCLESHVASKFEFETRLLGAQRLSFPSICAAGSHATVIHYGRNGSPVNNTWVLTDVGCEDVDGYCCDISRTWPTEVTERDAMNSIAGMGEHQFRAQLYEALAAVQHELASSIRVGETTPEDLQTRWSSLLVELLIMFDVFEGSLSKAEVTTLSKRVCPHQVTHFIGLDIHDTPSVSRSQPLQAGMSFSIEPGVYFPANTNDDTRRLPVKTKYQGVGLRVEDNFVIDPTGGIINLTHLCPLY